MSAWTRDHIDPGERERFQEIAESELLSLHGGNFARYQIRPSEFTAWQEAWYRVSILAEAYELSQGRNPVSTYRA